MSALFIFATVSLVYNAGDAVAHALGLSWGSAVPAQWIITLLANITADAILVIVSRYFLAQNTRLSSPLSHRFGDATLFGMAVLSSSSFRLYSASLLASPDQKGYEAIRMILVLVFFTAFTNLLLTLIIAGRIYFIKRKASSYVGKTVDKMYRTVIAIVIESGIMYPLALIVYAASVLVVFSTSNRTSDRVDKAQQDSQFLMLIMQPVLNQVIGIAPTLIIVRMGLGISVESADSQTVPTHTDAEPDSTSRLYVGRGANVVATASII
ncbi:hypothetical protein VNI00_010923 [Paramarasmius palmivorus]|uniref:G protein-coupled receptor n=1 Tax=Paramarasmius palmivorus TaxID=297713 RepID=A0AAW0CID1_9AGAR